MKLAREAFQSYLDTKFNRKVADASSAEWEVLGDDMEELTVELNPDTEQRKNILGQTKTVDNGYEPSMDADPFYADPEKKLYPKIRDIAYGRLKGDLCKTLLLEVTVEDTDAPYHLAYVREVMVKPTSYGSGTEGHNFPFTVSEDGDSVKGYVAAEGLKTWKPVFTEGEIPASASLSGSTPVATASKSKNLTD